MQLLNGGVRRILRACSKEQKIRHRAIVRSFRLSRDRRPCVGSLMRHLGETDDEKHFLGVSSLHPACSHFTGYEHTQIQAEMPGMEVSPSWPLETLSLKSGPAKWDFKNSFNEWLHFAAKAWTRSQNTLLDLFLWSVSERSYAMVITLSTDKKRSLSYFVPLLQYVLSGWPSHIGSTFLKLRIN